MIKSRSLVVGDPRLVCTISMVVGVTDLLVVMNPLNRTPRIVMNTEGRVIQ